MLDFLYFLGQVLSLVGLAYGAYLAIGHSKACLADGQARFERRRVRRRAQREADEQDAHVTELGYWP